MGDMFYGQDPKVTDSNRPIPLEASYFYVFCLGNLRILVKQNCLEGYNGQRQC
jgi:hypothetical protein